MDPPAHRHVSWICGQYRQHQPTVKWAADTLTALVQRMGVDHRGAHILVTKQLLDAPDIVARLPDGSLNNGLVNMMLPLIGGPWVLPPHCLGKDPLPPSLCCGARILPVERIGERPASPAGGKVAFV